MRAPQWKDAIRCMSDQDSAHKDKGCIGFIGTHVFITSAASSQNDKVAFYFLKGLLFAFLKKFSWKHEYKD